METKAQYGRNRTSAVQRESARPGAGDFSFTLFRGSMRQAKDTSSESGFQYFRQGLAQSRRRRGNLDPGGFHGGDLGFGITLAAGDDGAGMAHAAAGRRGAPGDEADHRLLAAALGLVLEELRAVFFGRAADLANHHDGMGLVVGEKHFEHRDEFRSLDRIAADVDGGGLAEPFARRLEYRLVSQRAGAGYDSDRAPPEDVA